MNILILSKIVTPDTMGCFILLQTCHLMQHFKDLECDYQHYYHTTLCEITLKHGMIHCQDIIKFAWTQVELSGRQLKFIELFAL